MIPSSIIFFGLAAVVLADPIPQGAATTDLGSSPTDAGSSPSDLASLSDSFASLSSLESVLSGMPTLASSAESVLLTAIPSGAYSGQECQTTTPAWYYSLPADVKSALSSYDSAFASWYSIHSTELNDMTATLPDNICAGTVFHTGSAASTTTGAGSASAGHTTATATGKTAGATSGTATPTSGASGSGSSSSSKAAAPRATGAISVGLAGVVGVFGLMVAL